MNLQKTVTPLFVQHINTWLGLNPSICLSMEKKRWRSCKEVAKRSLLNISGWSVGNVGSMQRDPWLFANVLQSQKEMTDLVKMDILLFAQHINTWLGLNPSICLSMEKKRWKSCKEVAKRSLRNISGLNVGNVGQTPQAKWQFANANLSQIEMMHMLKMDTQLYVQLTSIKKEPSKAT